MRAVVTFVVAVLVVIGAGIGVDAAVATPAPNTGTLTGHLELAPGLTPVRGTILLFPPTSHIYKMFDCPTGCWTALEPMALFSSLTFGTNSQGAFSGTVPVGRYLVVAEGPKSITTGSPCLGSAVDVSAGATVNVDVFCEREIAAYQETG